jgi:hypothetical protein
MICLTAPLPASLLGLGYASVHVEAGRVPCELHLTVDVHNLVLVLDLVYLESIRVRVNADNGLTHRLVSGLNVHFESLHPSI